MVSNACGRLRFFEDAIAAAAAMPTGPVTYVAVYVNSYEDQLDITTVDLMYCKTTSAAQRLVDWALDYEDPGSIPGTNNLGTDLQIHDDLGVLGNARGDVTALVQGIP